MSRERNPEIRPNRELPLFEQSFYKFEQHKFAGERAEATSQSDRAEMPIRSKAVTSPAIQSEQAHARRNDPAIPDGYYLHKKSGEIRRKTRRTHHGDIPYTINPDPVARFWEKVNKTETCWLWTGAKSLFGHGHLNRDGEMLMAHRYSWELVNGTILGDLQVLHKCDVPACVNPDHLFLGTQSDNIRDCIAKGRYNQKKLSDDAIREIREKYAKGGIGQRHLSREYGIAQSHVWRIVNGETGIAFSGPSKPEVMLRRPR